MAQPPLSGVLRYVRSLVNLPQVDELSDAALLHRFAAQCDEAALVSVLQRHGPLVLTTCRQVLADQHAAEDAFQTTFLVLARKARSIRVRKSLAPWLHRVAYRAALQVKISAERRRAHEEKAMQLNSRASAGQGLADWLPILHEEINRLPEKYRTPVVLCYLQGHSYPEAAAALGWPEGTVGGRLARARDLLQRRLVRRGVTLSATTWTVNAAEGLAAVPPRLLETTAHVAVAFASGRGTVPSSLAALAEGILRDMLRVRVKICAGLLLAVTLIGAGAGVLDHHVLDRQVTAGSAEPTLVPSAPPQRTDFFGDPLPEGAVARLGTVRWRHGDWTASVGFVGDGKELLTGGRDGWFRIWDVTNGKEVRQFGRRKPLRFNTAEALSPDGTWLASANVDGSIDLWDVATAKERFVLPGTGKTECSVLMFLPDGKTLISVDRAGHAQWWDVATGKKHRDVVPPESKQPPVSASFVTLAANGKLLALGQAGNGPPAFAIVRLIDMDSGKELRQINRPTTPGMQRLALSPDGGLLAWEGAEDQVLLYHTATGQEAQRLDDAPRPTDRWIWTQTALAFAPDGKTLVNGDSDHTYLWDVSTGKKIQRFGQRVDRCAFSPDQRLLATIWGHVVRLWDVKTGQEVQPLDAPRGILMGLHMAPDGRTLTAMEWGADVLVRRWDVTTGRALLPLCQVPRGDMYLAALSPDGRFVMNTSAYTAGKQVKVGVCLWDTATGKELHRIALPSYDEARIDKAAFSSDGKTLALESGKKTITLYDTATGQPRVKLDRLPEPYSSLSFAPDSTTLALYTSDTSDRKNRLDSIQFWDATTGQARGRIALRHAVEGPLRFTADGRALVASQGKAGVGLWDVASGKEQRRFRGGENAVPLAFSPDGRTLAIGQHDRDIQLFEVASAGVRCRFRGHRAMVATAAFTPDGRKLISGSYDDTALVWDITAVGVEGKPLGEELRPHALAALWDDLIDEDAAKAFRAMNTLHALPQQATLWLAKQVQPTAKTDPEQIRRRIAQLEGDDFVTRQKAATELERLGESARRPLEEVLATQPPLETRRRIEELLETLAVDQVCGEVLRTVRAVEVLEQIGTPEARQLLEKLASGAEGARLTREAKASLGRLAKRSAAN